MTRFLKKTALVLAATVLFSVLFHVGHSDAIHSKSGEHSCAVCQTLTSSHVAFAAPAVLLPSLVGFVLLSSFIFCIAGSLTAADSRAPPAFF